MPLIKDNIAQIRNFNRFYTSIVGLLEKHILESPYSLSEVRILFEISSRNVCTARQIKESIKMDEGYLSRLIEKFVAGGIIKKRRSRKDARVYDLSLSAKGKRIFANLNTSSDNEVRNLVMGIKGRDLQSLVNNMNNIRRILSRA
jgi:DNA-binding MarR family transcriptional regulator